jgi:hypothetical protein|tara:strand:- start:1325 stop:1918 length:594 start_codon:yes stop_codon:yes gene_type:complete
MPDNIILVKHGDKYSPEHVNRLFEQLHNYYPWANYYCYTDNPEGVLAECIPCFKKPSLKFWWNKLAMFSKDFPVKGRCLYFDLDMDIKSDPSQYINWDGLTILDAYWKKDKYMAPHAYDVSINSSIITWVAGEQDHIWEKFMSNRDYYMRKYPGIDRFLVHEQIPFNTFGHGIVSSVANAPVANAPVLMYNGIDYEL